MVGKRIRKLKAQQPCENPHAAQYASKAFKQQRDEHGLSCQEAARTLPGRAHMGRGPRSAKSLHSRRATQERYRNAALVPRVQEQLRAADARRQEESRAADTRQVEQHRVQLQRMRKAETQQNQQLVITQELLTLVRQVSAPHASDHPQA